MARRSPVPGRAHPTGCIVLVVVLAAVVLVVATETPAAAEADRHVPPVSAPVVDPFRPPATTYGAGNRGLTYDLAPATPVRATAAGQVVFAGWVAGTRHVTIRHADGLRTSYSFLASIVVRRGERVAGGAVVGTAGEGFHLGARVGDTYIDPASLFAAVRIEVRLVPHTEPPPPTDDGLLRERIALEEVVRERGLLERAGKWLVDRGAESYDALRAAAKMALDLDWRDPVFESLVSFLRTSFEPCTPHGADVAVPSAAGRVALLVGGLGSSSRHAAIDDVDVDTLGYQAGDVLRFAYGGGRIPDAEGDLDPALATIGASHYEPRDTGADLRDQGRHLADLLEQAAAARPGVPIDLYAHSMGGLVVRLALLELARRPGGLDALGAVVTIATPHQGSDLATPVPVLDPGERLDASIIGPAVGFDVPIDSPAMHQLGETSELLDALRRDGVPDGVDFRTVGARGDLVVTADKTRVSGHPSIVLHPKGLDAHARLPGFSGTTRELQLALAGAPPGCRGLLDRAYDSAVPEGISYGVSLLTLLSLIDDGH